MEMNTRRLRSAKIVATLGPSSSTNERIRALFEAGVDVFRLNFSHGTHEDHQARFAAIRSIESATGRPIGILADLQGPKLRLGTFTEGRVDLAVGQPFRVDLDRQPGDCSRAPLRIPKSSMRCARGPNCLSMTARCGFGLRPAARTLPTRHAWSQDQFPTAKG